MQAVPMGIDQQSNHIRPSKQVILLWISMAGFRRRVEPTLLAMAGIGLVTAVLLPIDRTVAADLVPLAYLVPVIFAGTRWGIWPAMLASVVAMVAADFFFLEPIYSFRVDNPLEAIDLLLFLVVSLISSELASRLRRETETLRRREAEIHRLYDFSRRVAACFTLTDLITAIQDFVAQALGQDTTLFVATSDGQYEPSCPAVVPHSVRERTAFMIASIGASRQVVTDEATGDKWLMKAVTSDTAVHGVMAINIGQAAGLNRDDNTQRIEAVLEDVSLTLKRLDLGQAIGEARARLQTELLRDAFHGSLSHELCSPLAVIRGSANVLESMTGVDQKSERELLQSILDETARLDGFIQNLLNASRVSAGGITPRPEWADPEDVINAAIVRRARRLTSHRVDTDFAPELSLIHVDSGLIEEACGQILENAAKYSPSGSTISINILTEDGQVTISIADEGSGITSDERELIGRRSFRSARHRATVPGSGLGFWIASTFVRANGGHINIFSPGAGSGTTVSISFPAGQITSSELIDFDNE